MALSNYLFPNSSTTIFWILIYGTLLSVVQVVAGSGLIMVDVFFLCGLWHIMYAIRHKGFPYKYTTFVTLNVALRLFTRRPCLFH